MSGESEARQTVERGKYIVIEGPEAVGKTTQVEMMIGTLATHGITARSDIREPGGSPIGESIRSILKDGELQRDPLTNMYLFNAARVETLKRIDKELNEGYWVVCDRNYWSSFAYQVWGEGLDEKVFEQVTDPLKTRLAPDVTIFLTTSPEEQYRRLEQRGDSDYFQDKDEAFHQRVQSGYIEAAQRLRSLVDGEGTPDEVHERVCAFIQPFINEVNVGALNTQTIHAQAMEKYNEESTK